MMSHSIQKTLRQQCCKKILLFALHLTVNPSILGMSVVQHSINYWLFGASMPHVVISTTGFYVYEVLCLCSTAMKDQKAEENYCQSRHHLWGGRKKSKNVATTIFWQKKSPERNQVKRLKSLKGFFTRGRFREGTTLL